MRRKLLSLRAAYLGRIRMYRAWVSSWRTKESIQAHGMAASWRIQRRVTGARPTQRGTHRHWKHQKIVKRVARGGAKGRMSTVATGHRNQASRRLCVLLSMAGLSTALISLARTRYLCILMPRFQRMTIKIMRRLDLKSLHPHRLSVDPTLYTCGLIAHEYRNILGYPPLLTCRNSPLLVYDNPMYDTLAFLRFWNSLGRP